MASNEGASARGDRRYVTARGHKIPAKRTPEPEPDDQKTEDTISLEKVLEEKARQWLDRRRARWQGKRGR